MGPEEALGWLREMHDRWWDEFGTDTHEGSRETFDTALRALGVEI